MNEREAGYIEDVLRAAERIAELVELGRERLDSDWDQRLIAERLLEILGEASKRLIEAGFKDRHPELPLHEAKGQRNHIAHRYDTLNYDDLWNTMASDVPQFAQALRAIRDAEGA